MERVKVKGRSSVYITIISSVRWEKENLHRTHIYHHLFFFVGKSHGRSKSIHLIREKEKKRGAYGARKWRGNQQRSLENEEKKKKKKKQNTNGTWQDTSTINRIGLPPPTYFQTHMELKLTFLLTSSSLSFFFLFVCYFSSNLTWPSLGRGSNCTSVELHQLAWKSRLFLFLHFHLHTLTFLSLQPDGQPPSYIWKEEGGKI